MTDEQRPPREFTFPAGDDANDARWLAGLIQKLRRRIDGTTYPGVSAILDEAQRAAQATAERAGAGKAHRAIGKPQPRRKATRRGRGTGV